MKDSYGIKWIGVISACKLDGFQGLFMYGNWEFRKTISAAISTDRNIRTIKELINTDISYISIWQSIVKRDKFFLANIPNSSSFVATV